MINFLQFNKSRQHLIDEPESQDCFCDSLVSLGMCTFPFLTLGFCTGVTGAAAKQD